jgi:uncharacterized membrane protein
MVGFFMIVIGIGASIRKYKSKYLSKMIAPTSIEESIVGMERVRIGCCPHRI